MSVIRVIRHNWYFYILQKPNPIILFYYGFQAEKVNMARKAIRNKHRKLNMKITELSASK